MSFHHYRVSVALVIAALTSQHSLADGALAVGTLNNDVATNGFAMGWTANYDATGDAKYDALTSCLEYTEVEPKVRVNCRAVTTFKNQCLALAWDPKPGTLGWGWAVAGDETSARASALNVCRSRAESGRKNSCAIQKVQCDGTPGQVASTMSSIQQPNKSTSAAGRR